MNKRVQNILKRKRKTDATTVDLKEQLIVGSTFDSDCYTEVCRGMHYKWYTLLY